MGVVYRGEQLPFSGTCRTVYVTNWLFCASRYVFRSRQFAGPSVCVLNLPKHSGIKRQYSDVEIVLTELLFAVVSFSFASSSKQFRVHVT